MSEEDKQEIKEVGKEETAGASDVGAKFETTPVIERAREEREKMEAANKVRAELLDREEAIMARKELGGRAEAGGESKEEVDPKVKAKEYAGKVMKGKLE